MASSSPCETIMPKARELYLAGTTVLRGLMSCGKSSRFHAAKILRRWLDFPKAPPVCYSDYSPALARPPPFVSLRIIR